MRFTDGRHAAHTIIVVIQYRQTILWKLLDQKTILACNAIERREPITVVIAYIGHDAYQRLRDPHQIGYLTELVRIKIQHCQLIFWLQLAKRDREAITSVIAARTLENAVARAENSGNSVFGDGFPHTTCNP